MAVSTIAVIGAGAMGSGIAQVAATSGYDVWLRDITEPALERGVAGIEKSLGRLVKAGQLSEGDSKASLGRIHTTTELSRAAREADMVIEAVFEDLEIKRQLFRDLDQHARPGCVLASNTSQLSITALAAVTRRPEWVIGMHWFNPPPVMKLVEIVMGVDTSDQTLRITEEVSHKMGKETVVCKDSQGFITSRALCAFLVECYRIAEEGLASKEDIDKAIRLGLNHPMGPFELSDYVGLDVLVHASAGMAEAFGDRHRLPQSMIKLVEAGHYGRKTGQGFYNYHKEPTRA